MASSGPGELPPRQFSFELLIHGFVVLGALEGEANDKKWGLKGNALQRTTHKEGYTVNILGEENGVDRVVVKADEIGDKGEIGRREEEIQKSG